MFCVVVIFVGAACRYIFHYNFNTTEEWALLAAFWLYFIGFALASREDSNINAELVSSFVKNNSVKWVLAIIKYAISLGVSLVATYWCFKYMQRGFELMPRTSVLKAPMVIIYIPVFISFLLTDIYMVKHMIARINLGKEIKSRKAGEETCS